MQKKGGYIMIWIFHRERADAASADNYEDLFSMIRDKEKVRPYVSPSKFQVLSLESPWSFTVYSPEQVCILYERRQLQYLTEMLKEAYKKKVGLIEISEGDFDHRLEILATSDIDIETLKKQWCLKYCEAHDYIVVENFSYLRESAPAPWQPAPAPFLIPPRPAQEIIPQISPAEIWSSSSYASQELYDA